MIMITGGLGFLGANLGKYLLDLGESVLLTRRRMTQLPSFLQNRDGDRFRVQECNILDLENLAQVIREYKVKSIVHGASIYLNTENYHHVCQVNVGGTMNVIETARSLGVRPVTFLSSHSVYAGCDDPGPVPEREEISIHAGDYITATKKAAELLSFYYRRKLSMDIRILRVARVYGPLSRAPANPVRQMVENAVQNIPVNIHSSPEEKYDFVYVKDCVRGIGKVHLAQNPQHYIYNVGAGKISFLSDFASVIKNLIPRAEIDITDHLHEPNNLRFNSCVDIKRISEEFGYIPEYDIEKGVKEYIDWLRYGNY